MIRLAMYSIQGGIKNLVLSKIVCLIKTNLESETYIALRVEFYKELLPLETELADLRPGERVDLRAILKRQELEAFQINPPVWVF